MTRFRGLRRFVDGIVSSTVNINGETSSDGRLEAIAGQVLLRRGDDSDYATARARNFLASTNEYFGWSGGSIIRSSVNGTIRLLNSAQTDFGQLQFGGTTTSFPSLKRVAAGLAARLADDSALTTMEVATPTTDDHAATKAYVDSAAGGGVEYMSVTRTADSAVQTGLFSSFDTTNFGGTVVTNDSGGGITFDATNGRFTVPSTGSYMVTFNLFVQHTSSNIPDVWQIRKNGTTSLWDGDNVIFSSTSPESHTATIIAPLAANDYVEFMIDSLGLANITVHEGTTCNIVRIA